MMLFIQFLKFFDYIRLKEDKEVIDLIRQFRGYFALDVLLAFVDKKSVKVLCAYA